MYANELKVIELILNYLDSKGNLSSLIEENYSSEEEFIASKINLFNFISINSIVSLNPNFSDKDIDKIIKGIQVINNFGELSNREIYNNIIACLKSGSYAFDKDNNVLIRNSDIRVVVSSSWLYDLVLMSKANTFLKVFLFNKNEEMDIHDENSLLNYLYHTKMFLISMSGNQSKLNSVYKHAVINTKGMLIGQSKIKSYDIRDTFARNVPSSIKTDITKYDFNNYVMFIEKAKKNDFYNKSLKEQKEMIKEWILEDESVSIETNVSLSKLIFLLDGKKSYEEISKLVDINMCYAGLFRIYMYALANMDINYDDLYLSKIRIKNYMDDDLINNYTSLKEVIKVINSSRYNEDEMKIKDKVINDIRECNEYRAAGKDLENVKNYKKVKKGIDEFIARERELIKLGSERNSLQNIIHYKKINLPIDIAFDNSMIMSLIEEANKIGRVYVDPKSDTINVDINNKEMGMNIFKAVIPIDDFLYFVECSNEELIVDKFKRKAA